MSNRQIKLMQGNEACVEGALAAGMKFYAGYPITPSTEIAELCSQKLPVVGGKFIQMEDEIAGMAATIGGSLAGLKSMTATSGPGFSLKQENIGYAALTEVPCVIVDVQRAGPSTGLPTAPSQGDIMQAKWGTHGDHPVIALSPTSVRETFDLTVKAFNLSEKYRTPVLLMLDEIVGHMREKIEIPNLDEIEVFDRVKPKVCDDSYRAYRVEEGQLVPPMAAFGEGFHFHVTGLMHDEYGFPSNDSEVADKLLRRIMDKIDNNVDDIVIFEEEFTEDAELLILAYGGTYRSARSAVKKARSEGLKVGLFKALTIWPFPETRVKELTNNIKKILVPELNLGQYVQEVERVVKNTADVYSLGKVNGEAITPDEILAKIREVL
ncbi:2-oxoacid:acceptor oxidoreductase subunit alpha [Alkaliphilus peptidifermentans]|uniref:2-oxoglutarate ferredoxin oxidoreductase, alpha subunit n=1 Tax=Alkaliphilus peptidifermentans DSM 18978 TaxID=1120976 RepID=A0A1G5KLE0_9FIRM|nr:2-oxoacid:acceptor oxidoreductase subunit alpha [Alkaliphilus peptidifermentans]SCZ01402.1 2-oxoglutarate ferredoxin oxidoreductase, alpha subunit [Alkaliphilus peptidifermentans DSM 18978]